MATNATTDVGETVKADFGVDDLADVPGSSLAAERIQEYQQALVKAGFVAEKSQCYLNARRVNEILGLEYWEGVMARDGEAVGHAWNMSGEAIIDYSPHSETGHPISLGEPGAGRSYLGVQIPQELVDRKSAELAKLANGGRGGSFERPGQESLLPILKDATLTAACERATKKQRDCDTRAEAVRPAH